MDKLAEGLEFELDKSIDVTQLDVEAARQSDIFYKWAERAAHARIDAEREKFELDLVEALLSIRCRRKPESFGIEKATDAGIKAGVIASPKYKIAFDKYIEAKEVSAILDKAVIALDQKKRMIETLVTLHGQQYFAGPNVPRDLITAYQEYQTNRREQLHTKQAGMTRRPRKKTSKKKSCKQKGD